jgi:hypothetical protein
MTAATSNQALADEIWSLMTAQGALFAVDAPIRQTLTNLAEYIARRQKRPVAEVQAELDAALSADPRFAREERNGAVQFVTSRQGLYTPRDTTDTHSFKQRMHEPEHPLPIDDISVVISTSRPAITTVEPVYISDYWQIQAAFAPGFAEAAPESVEPVSTPEPVAAAAAPVEAEVTPAEAVEAVEAVEAAPAEAVEAVEAVEAAPAEAVEAVEAVEAAPVEAVEAAPVEAVEAAPVEAAPTPAPVAPPARPARPLVERNTIMTLPDGLTIDLRRPVSDILAEHGKALEGLLSNQIEQDALRRIVSFGRSYYPEASIVSLGKNDLRKIRDYILERNEPLLDTEIIADLYYHNPRQPDYEGFRFSLNYRLNREKDFEFVGVEGARLWSTKGLPTIGSKRVKAAEMGQITSYLMDPERDDSLADQSAEAIEASGSVSRVLSFFEWEYGVLPLDASLSTLLPSPMLPDQRSAVLRFESPQHFTNYLVEVRYPTGNRGGWLQGLEDFFREHLVPGALITITRGAEPSIFQVTYEEAGEASERILTLDEKKNRFAFANLTYYCAVDESLLPSQTKYGRLKNFKSFPMGERRKSEMILEHVFENLGDQVGTRTEPQYALSLDDLYVGYNVLRPGSRALLRALLAEHDSVAADEATPGLYFYTPAARDVDDTADEDADEFAEVQPTRRRSGRILDDDE